MPIIKNKDASIMKALESAIRNLQHGRRRHGPRSQLAPAAQVALEDLRPVFDVLAAEMARMQAEIDALKAGSSDAA